jgi:1-acyl-sn-glycerol-3-phosphate acyltransferase
MNDPASRLQAIDPSTARPAPFRGLGSEIVRWLSLVYLRLNGWRLRGDWPPIPRAVLVAAPHTSNWDGLNMLAAAGAYRIKLRWMGKKSLTTGPFGGLIKRLGCVPIDRSGPHDVVRTMADAFAAEPALILAIPPEGTRSLARAWKSGFHSIAQTAQVPIIISVLDYGTKTMSIRAVLNPSADYDADLALLQTCYRGAQGKHRDRFAAAA